MTMTLIHSYRSLRFSSGTGAVTMPLFCMLVVTAGTASIALADTRYSSRALVSTGLQNLGNTCYLNSQLQCAYHIPRIRQLILDPLLDSTKTPDEENASAMSIGLQAMQRVFQQMETASMQDFAAPVAPRVLCQALGIRVMEQQDSQEFWKLLLPALQHPRLIDLYQGAYEDYITAVDGSGRERRREEPFLDLSLDVTW